MDKLKVLVLYAHPSQKRSEVNQPLFSIAQKEEGVTAVDLYYDYPNLDIHIAREQQRLMDHDVIVFQFPLYWYSTPSILKEWQDLVLEYGFAYGQDGTALKDKKLLCAISAGGKEDAYQSDGYNHFTIRQLLAPIEQMANLTHMDYLAPFTLFGSRTAAEEGRVETHTRRYQLLLRHLVNNQLDWDKARTAEQLCLCLDDSEQEETQ